jgi:NADH-quinone oxidoreductase subunit F
MPPKDDRPRYLAVNADESEPGTFKDRQIMERNPHLLLEGIMIAGLALQADAAYIYIRSEYAEPFRILKQAISDAFGAGILGQRALGFQRPFTIHIQRGAGAYICGEESGMLESMEGKKGQPRKRPPFPAQRGLWNQPTTVDNVETLAHVPWIINKGAQWFQSQGVPKSAGHTLFGVSGHVNNPGVFELPLGTSLREIIFKHAGGVTGGHAIKAVVPGGVSMPVLSAEQIDVAMDYESVKSVGTLLGTAGVIVMDDRSCMVRAALVIARFFEHESCGQCTQCREGTGWIYKTLNRIEAGRGTHQDLENIARCAAFMEGQTICAFSDAAAWAAKGYLTRFRPDFEMHIEQQRCPFAESFAS